MEVSEDDNDEHEIEDENALEDVDASIQEPQEADERPMEDEPNET